MTRAKSPCSGIDPAEAGGKPALPDRHRSPVVRDVPPPQRVRARPPVRRLLRPHRAIPDEVIHARRAPGEARCARQVALGRAAAETRPRARSRRRPRAPLPRRADDGVRPGRAARRLGDDPFAACARKDGAADDALPRRGRAARRPRRRPSRRRDHRARHARRARRRARDGDPGTASTDATSSSRPTSRRASSTS